MPQSSATVWQGSAKGSGLVWGGSEVRFHKVWRGSRITPRAVEDVT